MLCPTCKIPLVMAERQGVEIDYCPTCRGVWLDRGELDKIIDRATPTQQQPPQQPAFAPPPDPGRFSDPERQYEPRRDHDDRYRHHDHRYKKRKGFLGELFDFD